MGQPVVHWEFASHEPGALVSFYSSVVGWTATEIPQIKYRLVETGGDGGIGGGVGFPEEGGKAGTTIVYIAVDDVHDYTERVERAGGKLLGDPMDVPNVGTFALFADPDGRVVGLWKRAT